MWRCVRCEVCEVCEVCGYLHVISASVECVWFGVRVPRSYSIVRESRETTCYLCLCEGV